MSNWSKPYHGVSHLRLPRFQLTVVRWSTFTEAKAWRKPLETFQTCAEKTFREGDCEGDHTEAAKLWLESFASQYDNQFKG